MYNLLFQYTEQYVFRMDAFLKINIKYLWLLEDVSDEEEVNSFNVYRVLWTFLSDMHVSSDPEILVELSKNNNVLSSEQTLSLLLDLVDKFIRTIIRDIFDDVGDRDDETKKNLVEKLRIKYPHASHKFDYALMSKNKWNSIQKDFLLFLKTNFCALIVEESPKLHDFDFHQTIKYLSLRCISIVDEDILHTMFSTYVF